MHLSTQRKTAAGQPLSCTVEGSQDGQMGDQGEENRVEMQMWIHIKPRGERTAQEWQNGGQMWPLSPHPCDVLSKQEHQSCQLAPRSGRVGGQAEQ